MNGDTERSFNTALEEAERFGPQDPRLATILNYLAGNYATQGRYTKAEQLYKRSLAIFENALGTEHPHVAKGLNNLAVLYERAGRHPEAEALYARALRKSNRIV